MQLEIALSYAAFGWRVFPVYEVEKFDDQPPICVCAEGINCGRPGKHPRTPSGHDEGTTDPGTIRLWWTKWPNANIGIATGKASNLTVIDADCSDGKPGLINLTTLCSPHGGLPATRQVTTGSGGLHLYFTYCAALTTGQNTLAEAIDTRNDGGYVVAPGSTHISGGTYSWRNTLPTNGVPDWLISAKPQKKRGRPRKHAGFKIEKVESMLEAIQPDDRERWLAVGTILGRLYAGSALENDAWSIYESWAAKTSKFDEDRTGNLARMREMFYERSQEEPRAGGKALGIGSIISWAKEEGWSPFGEKTAIDYEPGNEIVMAEGLVTAITEKDDNRHFNVMGQIRDVLRTSQPVLRFLRRAHEAGEPPPETLVVRVTSATGLMGAMMRKAVLKTSDKSGIPVALPITPALSNLALVELTHMFPPLSGIAEWPLVGADGELISKPSGYDESTGLYFEIDPAVKINEKMPLEQASAIILEELFCDFPFENDLTRAGALGLLLSFMQRPLMKTCPAFAIVAPQPGSGKSTLVEIASIAVHGIPIASHAWTLEGEELRKAIHSMLIAKLPAVMFDNVGRGSAVSSDHLAKLITSEISTDRTLGASETRKEVNTLLVTFTGNNITFVRDLASRVICLNLNAQIEDPLRRKFKHANIKAWVRQHRSKWLSALIAIARAGLNVALDDENSRFEDFDDVIVRPVMAATGQDIRELLRGDNDEDAETDHDARKALELLWKWQEKWRAEENHAPWATSDVIAAVEEKTFDDSCVRILQRVVTGGAREWEKDAASSMRYALRALNGTYRFAPMVLTSKGSADRKKSVQWLIKGGPGLDAPGENPAEDWHAF